MKAVISAGPTVERIDPVRFISNRSSGRMGYELAAAARDAGFEVVLISGPTRLDPPDGVKLLRVESAAQMAAAVKAELAARGLLITELNAADIKAAPERIGFPGSPTKVKKIENVVLAHKESVVLEPTEAALNELSATLIKEHIL